MRRPLITVSGLLQHWNEGAVIGWLGADPDRYITAINRLRLRYVELRGVDKRERTDSLYDEMEAITDLLDSLQRYQCRCPEIATVSKAGTIRNG